MVAFLGPVSTDQSSSLHDDCIFLAIFTKVISHIPASAVIEGYHDHDNMLDVVQQNRDVCFYLGANY